MISRWEVVNPPLFRIPARKADMVQKNHMEFRRFAVGREGSEMAYPFQHLVARLPKAIIVQYIL